MDIQHFDKLDLSEHGADRGGKPQITDRRFYFQLQVYTGCLDIKKVVDAVASSGMEAVVYLDVNDPWGIGLLFMNENPAFFVKEARALLTTSPFTSLTHKPEMTMLGRTYALGREQDLEDWMLNKFRRNALNAAFPWAVWYPLRRKPEFAALERTDQGKILAEHGNLGRIYGDAGYAQDIRLSCFGIDTHDNEFVIGLVGPELYPLSRLVQDMRKTQQTIKFIQSLGPFFVGHKAWQSNLREI
jgi:hypothetical protein